MITVEEALKIVHTHLGNWGTEEIFLDESLGRILQEEIVADRDFPPFNRVTMDGIGLSFDQFKKGQRVFEIKGVAPAGGLQMELEDPSSCLEVMTGATVPIGVDAVVRYEDLEIQEGKATVMLSSLNRDQNIHFKGSDRHQGMVILSPGKCISASEVGVCATVGKNKISVSRLPRTLIVSSGDELVNIDKIPLSHQIRRSNVYRIATVLKSYQIQPTTMHLSDDYDEIVKRLESEITHYDLILLSGGVSAGKFDYLPEALSAIGVNKMFHKVKQRPGKPFWFGKKEDKLVFAFPGNPVSSFMCAQQYFKPWLDHSLQSFEMPLPWAELVEDVYFKPDLTYFLEVKIVFHSSGKIKAHPVKGNGSGDLANLVDADAFIQLPSGRSNFLKGEIFPFIAYRNLIHG
ncbi:MAG: molybdopterin molybdotransferase MoeA [Cyclobacteriaceae bacterium]|nr:molybdopterin molybdotransferase MoeA [Cyclobacteriaceae bacterium]